MQQASDGHVPMRAEKLATQQLLSECLLIYGDTNWHQHEAISPQQVAREIARSVRSSPFDSCGQSKILHAADWVIPQGTVGVSQQARPSRATRRSSTAWKVGITALHP